VPNRSAEEALLTYKSVPEFGDVSMHFSEVSLLLAIKEHLMAEDCLSTYDRILNKYGILRNDRCKLLMFTVGKSLSNAEFDKFCDNILSSMQAIIKTYRLHLKVDVGKECLIPELDIRTFGFRVDCSLYHSRG
jgi:hypothetical protein